MCHHIFFRIGWGGIVIIPLILLTACTLTTGTDSVPMSTPTSPVPTGDSPLTVTWADGGDLFSWCSSAAQSRRIASGGVIRPILSPDGAWIAFLRGPGGDPRTLWITDTPGTNERQLIDANALPAVDGSRRINQVVWAEDSRAILFNTLIGEGMDIHTADDLWRVDVSTGTGERLLPDGEGGQITLSPNGQNLALAAAGEYTQPGDSSHASGRLAFYNITTREYAVALEFPAVATGSQTRWYPAPRWLPDNSGIRVAIPPADLMYGEEHARQTALWWVPMTGEAVQTGEVEADFFGLPVFSADGAWITYLQRRTAPDQAMLTLMIVASDGDSPTSYAEGTLTPPEWVPGHAQFLYGSGDPGVMWLGGPGATPVRFPTNNSLAHRVIWADMNTYVFAAPAGEHIGILFGLLDVPTPVQPIITLDTLPPFDAVLPVR